MTYDSDQESVNGGAYGTDNDNGNGHASAGWGARESLRRNAGLHMKKGSEVEDNEVTPLLDDGVSVAGAPDGSGNGNGHGEWEGQTDFDGLGWWQRPSVCSPILCLMRDLNMQSILTDIVGVATTSLPSFRHCIRWTSCAKTQPYPISCMPGIPIRKIYVGSCIHIRTCSAGLG